MFVQHSLTIRGAGGFESLMSIYVGSGAAAAAGYAGNAYAYGAASAVPKSAPPTDSTDTSSSSSTNVTLSDEAKAYLAAHADEAKAYLAAQATADPPSMATLTTNARAWFDQAIRLVWHLLGDA